MNKINDVVNVMDRYKNINEIPKKSQELFLSKYSDITRKYYSSKRDSYGKMLKEASDKALSTNTKWIYDNARRAYETKMRLLDEERRIISDKYTEFIKRKR